MGNPQVTSTLFNRFKAREPQICNIVVEFMDGTTQQGGVLGLTFTDADIVSGGLNIDRAVFTGNKFEIGTCISAEADIILNNFDGRFNGFRFEGAKITIQVGLQADGRKSTSTSANRETYKNSKGEYVGKLVSPIDMGTFYVDNCPRRLEKITLNCLDGMAKLDIVIPNGEGWSGDSKSISNMIWQIKNKNSNFISLFTTSGGQQEADVNSYLQTKFSNNYLKTVKPPEADGKLTYRALLQYLLQLLGGYAYMDWTGKLHIDRFTHSSYASSIAITKADRYSSDVYENSVKVTGVGAKWKDNNNAEAEGLYPTTTGADKYAVMIVGNPLLNGKTANEVGNIISGIYSDDFFSWYKYYPFSVTCKPYMNLYPLDKVFVQSQEGTTLSTYVTNTNFTLNGAMRIEAKGETTAEKGFASLSKFTAEQTAIIEAISKEAAPDYSDVLHLNEMMRDAIGLIEITVNNIKYYYSCSSLSNRDLHNIDISYGSHAGTDVVYSFNSGGFAIARTLTKDIDTDAKRNALSTNEAFVQKLAWSYGVTAYGEAVLSSIKANTIKADWIQTGMLTSRTGRTYFNLDTGDIVSRGALNTDYENYRLTITSSYLAQQILEGDAWYDVGGLLPLGTSGGTYYSLVGGNAIDGVGIFTTGSSPGTFGSIALFPNDSTKPIKFRRDIDCTGKGYFSGRIEIGDNFSVFPRTDEKMAGIVNRTGYRNNVSLAYRDFWYPADNQGIANMPIEQEGYNFEVWNYTNASNPVHLDDSKFSLIKGSDGLLYVRTNTNWVPKSTKLRVKFYCDDLRHREYFGSFLSTTFEAWTGLYSYFYAGYEGQGTDIIEDWRKDAGIFFKTSVYNGFLWVRFESSSNTNYMCITPDAVLLKSSYDVADRTGISMTSNMLDLFAGDIYSNGVQITSNITAKKNISEASVSALSLIKNSKIYNYDYKTDEDIENSLMEENEEIVKNNANNIADNGNPYIESEEDNASSYGFVIDENTNNVPNEVISESGDAINLYSMASINWKATQELLTKIETLEAKISEMEDTIIGLENEIIYLEGEGESHITGGDTNV